MQQLKIDEDFRDLLPSLSKDKFKGLEEMILNEGYDGTPILIWNGYIVDGHHRYQIFKKHNIEFNTEEISLPKDADKSDVMEWMITYQDVRRNMCDAEKIFANDKVSARRIIEENEKRKLSTLKQNVTDDRCVQMDASINDDKPRDRSANTREQRAKLAGVSAGTIARYDTVMKSNNEELKQSMLSGDVKIGTAYKQINSNKNDKKVENNTISEDKNQIFQTQSYDKQTEDICKYMKTERQGDFNYDINQEINSLKMLFNEKITEIRNLIFYNKELMDNITSSEYDLLKNYLNDLIPHIKNIINELEEVKNEK